MRLEFFAAIILLVVLLHAHVSWGKIPLVIGGVFDIDTRPGDDNSAGMIPIVRMAIRHVNFCPKTLANYELLMEIKDVKVSRIALTQYIVLDHLEVCPLKIFKHSNKLPTANGEFR